MFRVYSYSYFLRHFKYPFFIERLSLKIKLLEFKRITRLLRTRARSNSSFELFHRWWSFSPSGLPFPPPYKIKFICPFPSFSLSFLPLFILFCLVATILITRRESNRNSRYRRRRAMARASIRRVLMASLRSKGSFSVNTALVRGDSYRISYRRHTDGNAHADTSA